MKRRRITQRLFPAVLAACAVSSSLAAPAIDPHQTDVGFFDIHVCNWPDQPLFLMALFSTRQFDHIARIELIAPDGSRLGPMDLSRYRPGEDPDKVEKRVLMTHYPIPGKNPDGWYSAHIAMKDGRTFEARDHVVQRVLPLASGHHPRDQSENNLLPQELRWDPVPGARFYQVYVRDEWESERHLLISKVISDNFLKIPAGLLKPGGSYTWRVHARDMNGDPEWGDFNHGSLAREVRFSVAE